MDRSGLNILIVEDEAVIATDIKSLLVSEGFNVIGTAKNATKAYDMLSTKDINFCILDIHLGTGPSGIDIAEVLHNKYQIPYLFLTSFSDEKTLEAAQEQAPYGYLVKPFQDQSLISTISIAWSNWKRSVQKSINSEILNKVSLTDQEKVITSLLAQGYSYKAMCEKLFISMNTLKYHAKNIYSKFDVKGRSELTALIYQ